MFVLMWKKEDRNGCNLDKESMDMSDFLTKEEIRQWRSSLEKLTLEEYAARLGKSVNTEKETNDIVDKVMTTGSISNMSIDEYRPKAETIKSIAQRALNKEKELAEKYNIRIKPTSITKKENSSKKEIKKIDNEKFVKPVKDEPINKNPNEYSFKKSLTPREQAVFDYFLENKNQIIYAKNLAELLALPRDYIYKYIKTLRNKMETECIVNAENGGFILK